MKFTLFCVLVLASCTKPNPAVCCLDSADCNEVGLDEVRTCSAGLACVEHQCEVPSCSMTGCMANAPVCNITTDTCDPCTDSGQCSRFTDTSICDTTSGSCVGCVGPSDCSGTTPVCDANMCRACRVDVDCPSGACGEDGACIAESAIVYLDAAGVDSGTCTKASPCKTFSFAIPKTSATRSHLVMGKGAYVESQILVRQQDTTANPLFIHGGGSTMRLPTGYDGGILTVDTPAVIRDLEFAADGADAMRLGPGTILVEHVHVHGSPINGILASGDITARDLVIEDAVAGVKVLTGQVELERATIRGGTNGVVSLNSTTTVKLTNVLVYGTSDRAIDLQYSGGSIAFSTIADSGMTSGSGPQAVLCSSAMSIRSSIIWTTNSTRVSVQGCGLSSTIAGPIVIAGAMNTDPMFVDPANRDYHLKATSPAKDAIDAGPALDFEGDSRPRGMRFDIGADEAP